MSPLVEIDGSWGEGGGQVLRTALSLAALTGRPTYVRRIRAGRRNPGLAPQHLAGVQALARLCEAEVKGAELGSTEVYFAPRSAPRPGTYTFDVAEGARGGSAGSVTLLAQTLLLPLSLAGSPSRLTLRGGTHVAWSPPFEYLEGVFLPAVARLGMRAHCRLEAWGFYPAGGGQISVEIGGGARMQPLHLETRGSLIRVRGAAVAVNLPAHIPQRIADRARSLLRQAGLPAEILPCRARSAGPGAGLFLIAEYEGINAGFSALGERGKSSEQVAEEACRDLFAFQAQEMPVDRHLADQLLLPLSLADGRSFFRAQCITLHLLTNAQVIQQFLPVRIEIQGAEGEPGAVAIERASPGK